MRERSFTEAQQNFASILDEAKKDGVVRIKNRDGQAFAIKPMKYRQSPLDVGGLDMDTTAAEIVDMIRVGRRRGL